MTPLFDTFLIVDWSAANTPKRGKDSVWIARHNQSENASESPLNLPTRAAAMAYLLEILRDELLKGRRIFAGFDFPFGYPSGAAQKISGGDKWSSIWRYFHDHITDLEQNNSNRFQLASSINRDCFDEPVFWGRPHQHEYTNLPAKKVESPWRKRHEFRIVERWQPPAKSVWQLAYNGAVGSQTMLGIARLQQLRDALGKQCQVWPFETLFSERLDADIVIAEIYPSMFETTLRPHEVKDSAQVRTVAKAFAAADRRGKFKQWLSRPAKMSDDDARAVIREEGWIVGAGHNIGNE